MVITSSAFSQSLLQPDLKFKTYTTVDGLCDNIVVKSALDKKGFLWLATHNGLSRFDGAEFKNYNYQPGDTNSLRSSWLTDLVCDTNGTLWISTEWGICWFDEPADCFHYLNKKDEIQVLYKAPLCVGSGNSVWLAAEDGLKKINTRNKTFSKTVLKRIPDPQCINEDSKGNIWVGTRGHGFFIYYPSTDSVQHFLPTGLPADTHIMDLYKEGHVMWAATSDGLLQINTQSQVKTTLGLNTSGISSNALMCVNAFKPLTGDSLLLCGTYDKRMLIFNKKENRFTQQWQNNLYRLNEMPFGIFYDLMNAGNILWIASEYGISKLNMNQQDYSATIIPEFNNTGKSKTLIKEIVATNDPAILWMSVHKPDSGLYQYHTVTGKTRLFSNNLYVDICKDSTGNLLALRSGYLETFSSAGDIINSIPLPAAAFCFLPDKKGGVWLGTPTGLAFINVHNKQYSNYPLYFNGTEIENKSFSFPFPVHHLTMDNKGQLWLSNIKHGLFSFDTATKKAVAYRYPFTGSYEAKNRAAGVVADRNGQVWVATMGGLLRYQPGQNKFIAYSRNSGLPDTYVYSICLDPHGIIWGRGNMGLFSLKPHTGQFTTYKLPLEMERSFFNQEISWVNGRPTMGFEGGFTVFNNKVLSGSTPPSLYITSCVVHGERLTQNFSDTIFTPTLNYKENVLSIGFAAIDYEQPERLNYSFMLEGFDKRWQLSGKRHTAFYTNLPPGHYTFKARARWGNGPWFGSVASFHFYIQPAFWQRLWFWPLVVVILIAASIWGISQHIRNIHHEASEKSRVAKMVAELEMKTLRSQMNPHFIFNSLNSVQKFIWENKKDDASDYLSKFARLIRMILDYSSQTAIPLEKELNALTIYIELEHRRSNARFEYFIRISNDIDSRQLMVPPLLLQPFVENAIWHGLGPLHERSGMLTIQLKLVDNKLVCEITDNGIGRAKAAEIRQQSSLQKKSLGMEITSQRLKLLDNGGAVLVHTEDLYDNNGLAAGTRITIQIPVDLISTQQA